MIDYEVKIFDKVSKVAIPLCAKDRFVSTPIISYTSLPAAGLFEMDNQTVRNKQSSRAGEEFALVTYQLDVVARTKAKCRQIYKAINDQMILLNFNRMSGTYVTYPDNTKIVRYVARYEAMIDQNGMIYRVV